MEASHEKNAEEGFHHSGGLHARKMTGALSDSGRVRYHKKLTEPRRALDGEVGGIHVVRLGW